MKEDLKHFGILGMHWGKKKNGKSISEQKERIADRERQKIVKKLTPDEVAYLNVTVINDGRKAAERVLDIMRKDKKRTFTSAHNKQIGEQFAKKVLGIIGMSVGAYIIGGGVSEIIRRGGGR